MANVKMPMADWETVVMALAIAQANGLIAYIDPIINEIDQQVSKQEG